MAGKRKFYARRKQSKKTITKISRQTAKKVIFSMSEKKFNHQQTVNAYTNTIAAIDMELSAIQQGTTQQTRIGDSIYLVGMQIIMTWAPTITSIPVMGDKLRCEIWMDTRPNGALANVLNVYDGANWPNFRNYDMQQTNRFKLLHQADHQINPTSQSAGVTTTATTTAYCEKFYIPINRKVQFSANTGAVADLMATNFFLLVGSFDGSTGGLTVDCRYMFRDM